MNFINLYDIAVAIKRRKNLVYVSKVSVKVYAGLSEKPLGISYIRMSPFDLSEDKSAVLIFNL